MRRAVVATLVFLLALGAAAIAKTHAHKKPHKKKTSHAKAAVTAKHASSVSHDTSSSSESADEPPDPHAKARFTSPPDAKDSPAYKYGTMTADACFAELDTRKISYQRETARGVYAPVRLTGPLHGVTFHSDVADKDRATT